MSEGYNIKSEDNREKYKKKIYQILEGGDYSSKDLIYAADKIMDNVYRDSNPKINILLEVFQEGEKKGLLLQDFTELIMIFKKIETDRKNFFSRLDYLGFSNKEKNIFKDIIENRRNGELNFFIEDISEPIVFVEDTKNIDNKVIVSVLTDILAKLLEISNKKRITFSFEEK